MKKVFVLICEQFVSNPVVAICDSEIKAQRILDEHAYEWRNAGYYVQQKKGIVCASSLGVLYFTIKAIKMSVI